ncbi:MAG TPA: glutathione S-transferase N-terminal domain-containing protein [Candidatus Aphodovivens excrementavium]|nr:glutathione S-transferase N-terminal domain-containing protein [Candidatus Aphodovivens excrementavium]
MAYLKNHLLYYKKACPYCQKVLRFMEDNKITMDTRDTTQPGNQNDLVRIGGKKQVPCLVIAGKALYESDDIIAYLKDTLANSHDE